MRNTKIRKTIATTLMVSTLIGCAGITSGCYKKNYEYSDYKKLEKAGRKIAEKYFEDELGYEIGYCSPYVFTGEYRERYLTNYVQGAYSVDDETKYAFSVNVDTGEIFTTEHYKEFSAIATEYIEDELGIEISDMSLSLPYEISESEYVPEVLPQDYIFMQEIPVDMDADAFEDYLKNPDGRDPIYMGITGTDGEDFDISDIDNEYFEDIEDEYNIEFHFKLKNGYEFFIGRAGEFTYQHYTMVEKDDFTLLITDEICSYKKAKDKYNRYEFTEDEIIESLVIKETDDGYSFSFKDKNDYLRFRIVVDDEDARVTEIVNAKRGVERGLMWEEIGDGLFVCKDYFTFNRVFKFD